MNKTIQVFLLSLSAFILASCSKEKTADEGVLFPHLSISDVENQKIKASEIFTDYRVIPLETTENSLLGGRFVKIIKKGPFFYIQSINDVVVFDNDGKFVNRLSHVGTGPEEYEQLYDFDVVEKYNEIWVSSAKGIYRYDSQTMAFKGLISVSFFVNEFKYLKDGTIIASTPDDVRFKIINMEGEVLQSFLENDRVNIGKTAIQFVEIDGRIISQLASTNEAICYDPESKEFSMINILPPSSELYTTATAREYHEKYGFRDSREKLSESFIGVGTFRKIGDTVLMTLQYPGFEWSLAVNQGQVTRVYPYHPEDKSMLTDDLSPTNTFLLFNTLIVGESDDSFIFMYDPEEDSDDNPGLIEVKKVKLNKN